MSAERLYGLSEADVMYFDPATVYESHIEPYLDDHDRPWEIEEWTVHPSIYHLPSAVNIIERIIEFIGDDGEVDEWERDQFEKAAQGDDVREAVEVVRELLASKITYKMADRRVAVHVLTWDEAGEPLLDGEPMYVSTGSTGRPTNDP